MTVRSIASAIWARKLRGIILVALLIGLVFGGGTAFNAVPQARADSCFTNAGTWLVKSASITVARVRFGATVCKGSNGLYTGVSPIFEGHTEGAGNFAGFQFDSYGSWVASSNPYGFTVRAESTVKECTPLGHFLPCSLTDRETYQLIGYSIYGPYITAPGFRLTSNTHFWGGGNAPQVTFVRIG